MVQDVSFIPPEECFSNFASEKLLPVAFAFQFPVPGSDSAQLIFTSEMILSRNRDIKSKSQDSLSLQILFDLYRPRSNRRRRFFICRITLCSFVSSPWVLSKIFRRSVTGKLTRLRSRHSLSGDWRTMSRYSFRLFSRWVPQEMYFRIQFFLVKIIIRLDQNLDLPGKMSCTKAYFRYSSYGYIEVFQDNFYVSVLC